MGRSLLFAALLALGCADSESHLSPTPVVPGPDAAEAATVPDQADTVPSRNDSLADAQNPAMADMRERLLEWLQSYDRGEDPKRLDPDIVKHLESIHFMRDCPERFGHGDQAPEHLWLPDVDVYRDALGKKEDVWLRFRPVR